MKFNVRTKITFGYIFVIIMMSLMMIGAHISVRYRYRIIGIVLVSAMLAVAIAYFVARAVTHSLRIIIKGIHEASEGNYHIIEGIRSHDEYGEVVAAFNQMVTKIQANEVDLHEKNEELLAQGEELSAQNEEILAQQEELQQAIANLTRHEELLSRLYRFSQSLTQTIDLDQLVKIAFDGMLEEAGAQAGAFLLYNPDTDELELKTMAGLSQTKRFSVYRLDDGLAGRAAKEKKPLVVGYNEGQLRSRGLSGELPMASEIYLPLVFHGKLLGVIALGRISGKAFTAEEEKRLSSLAAQVAIALHNSITHLEILQSLKHVQEVDRLKSEMINTVSHELRTPLASIFGFAELLLKKSPGEAKTQKYLTTIYKESERLAQLINNFLDLQRIEAGRFELTENTVNLEELIQNNVEIYKGANTPHTFSVKIEPNFPVIVTDPDRVSQVLGNLLANAIKFSPSGGLIEVTASRRSSGEVEIAVKDNGLGIPGDAMPNLFRPFFRVDNSDRRQIGGTGLGLSICQKFVQALGGDIWVRSEYGKGSTFTFSLPVQNSKSVSEKSVVKVEPATIH